MKKKDELTRLRKIASRIISIKSPRGISFALAVAALYAIYFAAAPKAGLMPHVPEKWRPSGLLAFLWAGAKSYMCKK